MREFEIPILKAGRLLLSRKLMANLFDSITNDGKNEFLKKFEAIQTSYIWVSNAIGGSRVR